MRRALLGLLAPLWGCEGTLARVEFTPVTEPPVLITLTPTKIVMFEGLAVATDVVGVTDGETQVHELSLDGSVLNGTFGFTRVELNADDEVDRFILFGARAGTGELVVTTESAEGAVRIPVTVTAQ